MNSHLLARITATALAITLASCTSELSSNPGPTLTSTTSTSTTTTIVAPPTTTTTTTTVTETPTTPETTLPSGPVDGIVPLLIGGADGGWLSLGGWEFDTWIGPVDADGDPIPPSVGPGTAITVTNLDADTPGLLGESTEACFDERIGPTVDVSVPAPDPPGFGYGALALPTPAWPLQPRPVAVSSAGPSAYDALGEAAFAQVPVDPTLGAVEQLVVTDLDGDGDDEALVVYEFVAPATIRGAPGDLSSVLLIDATTRQATTAVRSFVDQDLATDELPLIERFRILDVADVNGDGRMEVAVHAWYYEGASVLLFTYDGSKLTEVLGTGCGA